MKPNLFRFDEPYTHFELLETETAERRRGRHGGARPDEQSVDWRSGFPIAISPRLKTVRERLAEVFCAEKNSDLTFRTFRIGQRIDALAAFLNGMADGQRIDEAILEPALNAHLPRVLGGEIERLMCESVFTLRECEISSDFMTAVRAITEGRTAVFVTGRDACLLFDTRGYVSRAVGESNNEPVVLGPHEAFTENLRTNITLLRRILMTPRFVVSLTDAGDRTGTRIALCYLEGVTNGQLLEEIRRRLKRIDTSALLSIGTVEQKIEDHSWLPLPQTLKTERPDRVAAAIADGKVAILLEGSPIACVLPVTLGMLFASAEDASVRRPVGSLIRVVRLLGMVLSIWMPAYFLALVQHHAGQLSGEVLAVVQSSHVMVLLPLPAEMIFLLLVFQLVREAGVRAPGVVGHAIGIIGGLLLGQAAVAAHLVSTVVLIIVALAGLGNFTIPDYSTQVCIGYYRVTLCVAAALGGFLGIGAATLVTIAVLCSVKSFGVPMFSPFAPVTNAVRPFILRGAIGNRRAPQDVFNAEGRL